MKIIEKYQKLDSEEKQVIQMGLMGLISFIILVLTINGLFHFILALIIFCVFLIYTKLMIISDENTD